MLTQEDSLTSLREKPLVEKKKKKKKKNRLGLMFVSEIVD